MAAKTREEIIANAKSLEKAGAPIEEIDNYVRMASQELTQQPAETFLEKSVGVMRELAPFPTSFEEAGIAPTGNNLPIMSGKKEDIATLPLRPITALEKYGSRIKEAGIEPIERGIDVLASKAPDSLAIPAIGAAEIFAKPILRMATPFTPSEFGTLGSIATLPFKQSSVGKVIGKEGKAMAEQFVGTPTQTLESGIKRGSESAGQKLIRMKDLSGNREEVFSQATDKIEGLENKIISKIKSVSSEEKSAKFNSISRNDIAAALDDVVEDLGTTGTAKRDVLQIKRLKEQFVEAHPETADVSYWNTVKRALYKRIGNKNYVKDQTSAKIDAEMSLANRIKTKLEEVMPSIKTLNREQGDYLQIRNNLARTIAGKAKEISLTSGLRERAGLFGARLAPSLEGLPSIRATATTGSLALPKIERK